MIHASHPRGRVPGEFETDFIGARDLRVASLLRRLGDEYIMYAEYMQCIRASHKDPELCLDRLSREEQQRLMPAIMKNVYSDVDPASLIQKNLLDLDLVIEYVKTIPDDLFDTPMLPPWVIFIDERRRNRLDQDYIRVYEWEDNSICTRSPLRLCADIWWLYEFPGFQEPLRQWLHQCLVHHSRLYMPRCPESMEQEMVRWFVGRDINTYTWTQVVEARCGILLVPALLHTIVARIVLGDVSAGQFLRLNGQIAPILMDLQAGLSLRGRWPGVIRASVIQYLCHPADEETRKRLFAHYLLEPDHANGASPIGSFGC